MSSDYQSDFEKTVIQVESDAPLYRYSQRLEPCLNILDYQFDLEKILFKVKNNGPLHGEVRSQGAKNSVLLLIVSSLLTEKEVIIDNVPQITEVYSLCNIISSMKKTTFHNNSIKITSIDSEEEMLTFDDSDTIRASILLLGTLLYLGKGIKLKMPGGCDLNRGIDIHIDALSKMGATIFEKDGYIIARAEKKLIGIKYYFRQKSVTGTANIILASIFADGPTKLYNFAKEPEITDLIDLLNKMGADIKLHSDHLKIKPVSSLEGARHKVIDDRIEIGTYIIAVLISRGEGTFYIRADLVFYLLVIIYDMGADIYLNSIPFVEIISEFCERYKMKALKPFSRTIGILFEDVEIYKDFTNYLKGFNKILISSLDKNLIAQNITTKEYPFFPTDLQPQMTVLNTVSQGKSFIRESIYQNRFSHINELNKVGASLSIDSNAICINGSQKLHGLSQHLNSYDLRSAAAMILSGIASDSYLYIKGASSLYRGYSGFIEKMRGLGAEIELILNT